MKVVYLGKLADFAGRSESTFWSSSGEFDWANLVEILHTRVNPAISEAAADERTRIAVNGRVLSDKTCLKALNGDEIALLPPVSGG